MNNNPSSVQHVLLGIFDSYPAFSLESQDISIN